MGKKDENSSFICANCGGEVNRLLSGGYRNHCPFCLFSLHADIEPGDRLSDCGGLMEPIAVRLSGNKGIQILHRCVSCGFTRYNMSSDDPIQPDNYDLILKIMRNM